MERRLLLDVVVLEGATVLELLAGEDEPLLVGGDPLLVLDLGLDGVDGVGALYLERDGLAGERFDEDLHFLTREKGVFSIYTPRFFFTWLETNPSSIKK